MTCGWTFRGTRLRFVTFSLPRTRDSHEVLLNNPGANKIAVIKTLSDALGISPSATSMPLLGLLLGAARRNASSRSSAPMTTCRRSEGAQLLVADVGSHSSSVTSNVMQTVFDPATKRPP